MQFFYFIYLTLFNKIHGSLIPYNLRYAFNEDNKMTISWSTKNVYENKPIIYYGDYSNKLDLFSEGDSLQYHDSSVHHHVSTNSLEYEKLYFFSVGDGIIMSQVENFTSVPEIILNKSKNIAIYGDMGVENSDNTIHRLKNNNDIDFFIHMGDISYADDKGPLYGSNTLYESTYDKFQEMITFNKPYMVCPGNHDISCHSLSDFGCNSSFLNFTAFNSRFKMPSNGSKNMWYSFNFGPIHFVSINTETDYPDAPTTPHTILGSGAGGGFGNQLKWLENDLSSVNRTERPWIIVYGHRPMYSKNIIDIPFNMKNRIRNAFENILLKYNVNIYFSGHIHAYERMTKVKNGKKDKNGIYHIISGAAGCQEKPYNDDYLKHDYTEYYNYKDFGYGILTIFNNNSLVWKYYRSSDGILLDYFNF